MEITHDRPAVRNLQQRVVLGDDDDDNELLQDINSYEPNPEDQILLELSKQKTVMEIDQKFFASTTNKNYVFPRKLHPNLQDDENDDYDGLNDCTFYNLNTQPSSNLHQKLKRQAAAQENKQILQQKQINETDTKQIKQEEVTKASNLSQSTIIATNGKNQELLKQSSSTKKIEGIDDSDKKDSKQQSKQYYYNIPTSSGSGKARKIVPSTNTSMNPATVGVGSGPVRRAETVGDLGDSNSPSKNAKDQGHQNAAIKISHSVDINKSVRIPEQLKLATDSSSSFGTKSTSVHTRVKLNTEESESNPDSSMLQQLPSNQKQQNLNVGDSSKNQSLGNCYSFQPQKLPQTYHRVVKQNDQFEEYGNDENEEIETIDVSSTKQGSSKGNTITLASNKKKKPRMKIVVVGVKPTLDQIHRNQQIEKQTIEPIPYQKPTRNEATIIPKTDDQQSQHYSLSPMGSSKKRAIQTHEVMISSTSSSTNHQFARDLPVDSTRPVKTDGNEDDFYDTTDDLNQRRLGSGERYYRHSKNSSMSGNTQKILQKNKSIHAVLKVSTTSNTNSSISEQKTTIPTPQQQKIPSPSHLYNQMLNGYAQIQRQKKPVPLLGTTKSRSEENRIVLKVTTTNTYNQQEVRRKLVPAATSDHRNLAKSIKNPQQQQQQGTLEADNVASLKSTSAKIKAPLPTNSNNSTSNTEVLGVRKISGIRINMKPSSVKKSLHSLQGQQFEQQSSQPQPQILSNEQFDSQVFDEEHRRKMAKKSEQLNQILVPHANRLNKGNTINLTDRNNTFDSGYDLFKSNVSSAKASSSQGKSTKMWLSGDQMNSQAAIQNGYSWIPPAASSTKSSCNNSNNYSTGNIQTGNLSNTGASGNNSQHAAYNATLINGKSPLRNFLLSANNNTSVQAQIPARQSSKTVHRPSKTILNSSLQQHQSSSQQMQQHQPLQQQNFILNLSSYS